MVIVEGPDGGGKTTLIKELSESLGVEVAPRACSSETGPVKDLMGWTTRFLNHHSRNLNQFTLHDRFPLISEPIYGSLVRGYLSKGFDTPWYSEAWQLFTQLKPIIIFCLPPLDVVIENVKKEDIAQMDGVTFNIRGLYWQYNTLMHRLRAPKDHQTVFWDYTDPRAELNKKVILGHLQVAQTRRSNFEY